MIHLSGFLPTQSAPWKFTILILQSVFCGCFNWAPRTVTYLWDCSDSYSHCGCIGPARLHLNHAQSIQRVSWFKLQSSELRVLLKVSLLILPQSEKHTLPYRAQWRVWQLAHRQVTAALSSSMTMRKESHFLIHYYLTAEPLEPRAF